MGDEDLKTPQSASLLNELESLDIIEDESSRTAWSSNPHRSSLKVQRNARNRMRSRQANSITLRS